MSSGPTGNPGNASVGTPQPKIGMSSDALDEVLAEVYSYTVDGILPTNPLMRVMVYTAKQIVRQGQTD